MLWKNVNRGAKLFLAATVAMLTFAVVARATQVITVPNATLISYNLTAGANSPEIGLPSSQAVFVMGVCTTSGFRGVGQVTLLRVPGAFVEWVGLESTAGAAITQGFGAATGTHIVYLDYNHQVDIEVQGPDAIRVHNGAAAIRAGNVKLIW